MIDTSKSAGVERWCRRRAKRLDHYIMDDNCRQQTASAAGIGHLATGNVSGEHCSLTKSLSTGLERRVCTCARAAAESAGGPGQAQRAPAQAGRPPACGSRCGCSASWPRRAAHSCRRKATVRCLGVVGWWDQSRCSRSGIRSFHPRALLVLDAGLHTNADEAILHLLHRDVSARSIQGHDSIDGQKNVCMVAGG